MACNRGVKAKFPCPVCMVPKDQLSDLTQTFQHRSNEISKKLVGEAARFTTKSEKNAFLKQFGLRAVEVTHFIM